MELRACIDELSTRNDAHVAELQAQRVTTQQLHERELRLGNDVRRRHPLRLARAISVLGKPERDDSQIWRAYFDNYTLQDWEVVLVDAPVDSKEKI